VDGGPVSAKCFVPGLGGGAVVELNPCQAAVVYECLKGEMKAAYATSGWSSVRGYQGWLNVAKTPYQSAAHGGRYVNNYADSHGDYRYAKYEDSGVMPLGSVLAKDSFVVKPTGKVSIGPLSVMEKMAHGFNKESGDWRYSLIMPNGKIVGTTNGKNSKAVAFCNDCHSSVADGQDFMMFLPEADRK